MKKIYCTPATLVTTITTERLIAQSLRMYNNSRDSKTIDKVEDVLVKQNRSSYNVWDDDWSN